MNNGFKGRFLHIATIAILLLIVVGGLGVAYPSWRRNELLRHKEAELKLQIEEKKREIEQYAENQRRFKTDRDFVETIARRNRRVFPGELVFVFDD